MPYVALVRRKSLIVCRTSLFSTVYSRATATGTVPRAPGRSTCIDHTRDELRSPYGGRVMIIRMQFSSICLSHYFRIMLLYHSSYYM